MHALIMAGGEGSRLGLGEKPLVCIHGRPMIQWVIEAFSDAGCSPVVVLSSKTPYTRNWCRANSIPFILADGNGYLEDLIYAVTALEEGGPIFTSVSDIPCISADIIRSVCESHRRSGMEACSTWVPVSLCREVGTEPRYLCEIDGVPASPVGVNILQGSKIGEVQEELCLLLNTRELVFNVNTRSELALLEQYFQSDHS